MTSWQTIVSAQWWFAAVAEELAPRRVERYSHVSEE